MKYFLVFRPDTGSREDCSVYYSNLIIADSVDEAKDKFIVYITQVHKKQLEKHFKRLLTQDELSGLKDNFSFDPQPDEDDDLERFEILEVNPII